MSGNEDPTAEFALALIVGVAAAFAVGLLAFFLSCLAQITGVGAYNDSDVVLPAFGVSVLVVYVPVVYVPVFVWLLRR